MIPGNRTAQPNAAKTLRLFVIQMQEWFRDHMERLGYQPKTFMYESEDGTGMPKIDFLYVEEPDAFFHDGDYVQRWNKVLTRIAAEGFPIWQQGVLTLVIAEMHVQDRDGRLRDGTTFVGGAGTNVSGVAMVTGETLARLSEAFLTDNRFYNGLVIPAIGPYPLVQDVSFAWFEGTTVSSTSSSAQGAVIHELGHGLGLWHEFRNDRNFNGDLMGNGLRGWRGSLFPQLYPGEDVHLSTASALALNYSRFFNATQLFTDHHNPQAFFKSATEAGVRRRGVQKNGWCGLGYRALDSGLNTSLLGGALLIRAGQVVADTPLDGGLVNGRIDTYDYTPGVEDEWSMLVTDRQGNRSVSTERITCAAGHNRAPQPQIEVVTSRVHTGDDVVLDAVRSTDPDGSWINLTVRWDLDGDGSFDTEATTDKTHTITYTEPGVYQVVAELTDEVGDSSVSAPIGIRVERREALVSISINPGNQQNSVNPRAEGDIWVAVLSGSGFDPLRIDVSSVRFGPGDAAVIGYETGDFNGDRAGDLALRFRIPETAIRCGHAEATLTGTTMEGQSFAGTDSIKTVRCTKKYTAASRH
jgi:hypothetical protein